MKIPIPLLILATLFTGCLDATNNECKPVDESFFLEEHALKAGVTKRDSGLLYRVIKQGDGEIPSDNQVVFVYFNLSLITGGDPVVSSNELTFYTLNDEMIPGLREGIAIMAEGSTYEFVIPTELAYNNNPPQGTSIRCGSVIIARITLDSFLRDALIFLNENAVREDVDIEVTESGLQYRVIEEGEGDSPSENSIVKVKYKGTLTNGYIFDQNTTDNGAEFRISDPNNPLIPGFAEGLQLMTEGSRYEFFIPPDLAYGNNPPRDQFGRELIPQNVILVFEIELVDILDN